MSGPRLFPSEGKTSFGEWIKAGALKQGDKVSTAKSIAAKSATPDGAPNGSANHNRTAEAGVTPPAANDNAPLVVSNILLNDHLARVYNFEVESRPGEITHNYLVGDEQAWVHNGLWERIRGPLAGAIMEWFGDDPSKSGYNRSPEEPVRPGISDNGPRCEIEQVPPGSKPKIGWRFGKWRGSS